MAGGEKRKSESKPSSTSKKTKYSKFKSTSRGNDDALSSVTSIEPGSAGIWATCVRGLEAKATSQLREVLDEYAVMLYPEILAMREAAGKIQQTKNFPGTKGGESDSGDIESAIKAELEASYEMPKNWLFKTVRIDVACVLFFKVDSPIDPVTLVQRICKDASDGKATKQTRHINRLTPMTLIGKASLDGLEKLAKEVLPPHFSQVDGTPKTYAIRPTIRNSDVLRRQEVIEKIAAMVGQDHSVNLSKPDLVILVEIYKNVCGMSVVAGDYETLKRYNLNELYNGRAPVNGKSSDLKSVDKSRGKSMD